MLDQITINKRIGKQTFQEVLPRLESSLGALQRDAQKARMPVILVFEGWDTAGKGRLINRLTQALDPRGFQVHATSAPDQVERHYPWLWRFWRQTPAAGQFAIFDRSWYGRVLVERMQKLITPAEWREAYDEIVCFERQLADWGVVIVKFWLHIDRKEQRSRLRKIAQAPALSWKADKDEWRQNKDYRQWSLAVEEMFENTNTAHAPWTVIEATQSRFALAKLFETVVHAVREQLERRQTAPAKKLQPMPVPADSPTRQRTILDQADLSQSLEQAEYDTQLEQLQQRLLELEHRLYQARIPTVIVYEGQDAAGKGGNIRRLTRGLDPRGYQVVPVAAPTAEERDRHYLWRFWRALPKAGHITIFDRSWYGRVLVERVEGFCAPEDWKRAYREINEFERNLTDFGTVILKFWLQIDREEQLRRFQARQEDPDKQWKITEEDWRNREKWQQYDLSIVQMLQKTSTTYAPWTILEANCKRHARIKALAAVVHALENALQRAGCHAD